MCTYVCENIFPLILCRDQRRTLGPLLSLFFFFFFLKYGLFQLKQLKASLSWAFWLASKQSGSACLCRHPFPTYLCPGISARGLRLPQQVLPIASTLISEVGFVISLMLTKGRQAGPQAPGSACLLHPHSTRKANAHPHAQPSCGFLNR